VPLVQLGLDERGDVDVVDQEVATIPDMLTSTSHESVILICRMSQSRNLAPVKSAR
jgi:hypothetical protein